MFLFVCLFFNINTVKDMFYAGKKKKVQDKICLYVDS